MKMNKMRANEIILLDPSTCDISTLKRIIYELQTRIFPFKEETKEDLLFDFKFELKKRI